MRRINSQVMKNYNVMLIVRTVQQNAPISRTELTAKVGLTTASVINITNALIEAGVLRQVGHASGATHGRRAVMLDVNADALYTVGVHLSTDGITVGVSNFCGKIISSVREEISSHSGVEMIVERIEALVRQTIAAARAPWDKVLGVGLALPGPLDSRRGVMINPPNFPDWDNVPICDLLRRRLGLPVCCDRETNAAALAEHFYGAAVGSKTAFVMSLFRLGVGGGMISSGNVLHGFRDGAGEIGHTTVDPAGPKCMCGNYGCLEAMVAGSALVRQAQQLYKMNISAAARIPDVESLTLEDVFRLSQDGDDVCLHVVRQAAAYISVALGNVINLFSPEVIVLAGPIPAMSPQLVELVREHVRAKQYPRHCPEIRVVVSEFGALTFAMGGVVLALDAFLAERMATYG